MHVVKNLKYYWNFYKNDGKRHDFKTSYWQFFEIVFLGKTFRQYPVLCFFQSGIQMDVNTCNHISDNYWRFDYLPVLNLWDYYRSYNISLFLVEMEYKGGYLKQVKYKGSAHMKKRNRKFCRYTFHLFHRRLDNAIYTHGVLSYIPSRPCGIWHDTKELNLLTYYCFCLMLEREIFGWENRKNSTL